MESVLLTMQIVFFGDIISKVVIQWLFTIALNFVLTKVINSLAWNLGMSVFVVIMPLLYPHHNENVI